MTCTGWGFINNRCAFDRSIGHLENICKAASQMQPDSAVSVGRIEAFLRALNIDLVKIVERDRELEEMLQSREIQHQNNVYYWYTGWFTKHARPNLAYNKTFIQVMIFRIYKYILKYHTLELLSLCTAKLRSVRRYKFSFIIWESLGPFLLQIIKWIIVLNIFMYLIQNKSI